MTRESEWDDRERDRLEALAVYEAGICECGVHKSRTAAGEHFYTFDETQCPVCAGVAQYGRHQAEQDRQAEKHLGEDPPAGVPRPGDGRHVFLRPMTDDEVATVRGQ